MQLKSKTYYFFYWLINNLRNAAALLIWFFIGYWILNGAGFLSWPFFISGSALIPYMERFGPKEQELFKAEFIKRIKKQFENFPAIYSFKRILLYGIKK